jgi:hypothetical protein
LHAERGYGTTWKRECDKLNGKRLKLDVKIPLLIASGAAEEIFHSLAG